MKPFLRRVRLKNYKSIAACDVALGPLTLLVGPNGAGKSNFLDALRLLREALDNPLDHALRQRGGIADVRRKSTGHPHNFGVEVDFDVPGGPSGRYAFEITARGKGSFDVERERLQASTGAGLGSWDLTFDVHRGEVQACSLDTPPKALRDRLFLVNLSGFPGFRAVYDAFLSMGFYNLNPAVVRAIQPPDPGVVLTRDGSNLASVVARMAHEGPDDLQTVQDYLRRIAPGIEGVEHVQVANKETLEFRQAVAGARHPWRFYANSMSDGTLRALGVLVALFQGEATPDQPVSFVGIEEPEAALHPAAAGLLFEALRLASGSTQVVATTHSPQLLEDESIEPSELLAVSSEQGVTRIGAIDARSREAMRERLMSAGELLQQAMILPTDDAVDRAEQLDLFGDAP